LTHSHTHTPNIRGRGSEARGQKLKTHIPTHSHTHTLTHPHTHTPTHSLLRTKYNISTTIIIFISAPEPVAA
ncbi:hypothetical protein, partial [[Eubacterium] cellulosolvens]